MHLCLGMTPYLVQEDNSAGACSALNTKNHSSAPLTCLMCCAWQVTHHAALLAHVLQNVIVRIICQLIRNDYQPAIQCSPDKQLRTLLHSSRMSSRMSLYSSSLASSSSVTASFSVMMRVVSAGALTTAPEAWAAVAPPWFCSSGSNKSQEVYCKQVRRLNRQAWGRDAGRLFFGLLSKSNSS